MAAAPAVAVATSAVAVATSAVAVTAPAVAVTAPAVAVADLKVEPQRPAERLRDALTPTHLAYETNTLIGQFRLCHPLCCSWHDDASAR